MSNSEQCSNCGEDTKYSQLRGMDWRVKIEAQMKYPHGPAVADYNMLPPIEDDKYFCDLGCLRKWINKEAENWR